MSALDPDAEHRKGAGGALDPDDAAAEKALARALLAYLRAGKYEEARALCRVAGHDWRAAVIGGITSFRWDAVGKPELCRLWDNILTTWLLAEKEETEGENGMDVVQSEEWVGNKRRKLWSDVCQRTAMNVSSPTLIIRYSRSLPSLP